jgi:CheY-like chemotaxis protein
MRILVVEDDPAVLQALAIVLEQEGYDVATAGNGREALAALEGGRPPDLILLDLWMPVMNGWEFLERLRADRTPARELPVIVVTADAKAAARGLPVQAVVTKPMDVDVLLAEIRRRDGDRHPAPRSRSGI